MSLELTPGAYLALLALLLITLLTGLRLLFKRCPHDHRPPTPAVGAHRRLQRPNSADRRGGEKAMNPETTTSAPEVGSSAVVLPVCPSSFRNHRHAAAWMIRMGRALDQSNVPISPHISRRDNNDNFEIARKLIACGKRIAEKYGDESKESKLRARLRAALARQNAACPPGTAVLLTSEDGHTTRTETIGEAYEEGCHAFIRVRHATAPVPLHLLKTLP